MKINTIIELFDEETPIHNVVSALANRPEKIVFLGQKSKYKKMIPHMQRFLTLAGMPNIEIVFQPTHGRSLSGITKVLEECVKENTDCAVDLTGGGELYAAAVGIVFERCKDRNLQLHQYNIVTGKVYDCDEDGNEQIAPFPGISVEQLVALHGGIVESTELCLETLDAKELQTLERTVSLLWSVVGSLPSEWNEFIGTLNRYRHLNQSTDPMKVCFPADVIPDSVHGVLCRLAQTGVLEEYSGNPEGITYRYVNPYVEQLMNKGGNLLEQMVFLAGRNAKEKTNIPVFQSVSSGVVIDWDGIIDPDCAETVNEIDGILMHGAIPLFVSCKSGGVTVEELYKLSEVTRRFGSKYAKKALFCSEPAEELREGFLRRASDMHIRVFTDVKTWHQEDFIQAMTRLGTGT